MKSFVRKLFLYVVVITLFSKSIPVVAQDSSHLQISLLTCTPGEELYSIFGHSALRIVDSSHTFNNNELSDIVYNYGTFNFDDEGFYLKFIRGKLLYYISRAHFEDFKFEYQTSNRGITEQVLNLSLSEKIAIQKIISENLEEENKYYQYDFFLDNCTTRLRDIIVASKHPNPILPAVMPVTTTFRNAIHQYLDKGRQYWSKLGIDILLGVPTDAVMTTAQQQFLPDNLMTALDETGNVKIVESKKDLYRIGDTGSNFSWFTPMVFFSLLLMLFVTLSFSKNQRLQGILTGLDGCLFFLTGLLGVVLVFMMTGTDHSMTKNNYNILWAWPSNLVAAFFINRRHKLLKRYFLLITIAMLALLAAWFFLPQQMNNALLPLVLLLLYRSYNKYQQI